MFYRIYDLVGYLERHFVVVGTLGLEAGPKDLSFLFCCIGVGFESLVASWGNGAYPVLILVSKFFGDLRLAFEGLTGCVCPRVACGFANAFWQHSFFE